MADLTNSSAETLGFSEVLGNGVSQDFGETVLLNAFYPATPFFRGGDLAIHNEAMDAETATEYIQTRGPIGFSRFREFVAGEYRYSLAYVNFVFRPIDGTDTQISLTEARFVADVPDRSETDVGTITNASLGLDVAFTTPFAAPPRVTVTPISSVTPVVAVLTAEPTTTGFTVKIFDLSGTAVTGSFMWTALGY